jgi:hypothetical protein
MASPQPLFRAEALEHYARSREKTVLPRFVSPPVFLCCWLLLGLLALSTALAWLVKVPISITASGVLLPASLVGQASANGPAALLFVPADPSPALPVGQTVTMRVALTGTPLTGAIARVLPGVVTPQSARQRYALAGDQALVITQPSVVVQVTLGPELPADVPPGSVISAQMSVGSVSLLSFFPRLLDGVVGG